MQKPRVAPEKRPSVIRAALAVESGGGGQHLTHTGAPAWTFITNDKDVAFLVGPVLYSLKTRFFSVEAARRTGKRQLRHTRNLNDRTIGSQIADKSHYATGRQQRFVG